MVIYIYRYIYIGTAQLNQKSPSDTFYDIKLRKEQPSRFGSVVAHSDLDGDVSGSSRVQRLNKGVLTVPQPVLVIRR